MKTFYKCLLILLALFGVERFCRWKTDGFREQKIYGENFDRPPNALPNEVKELLTGPYTFLGSGVQSYVFISSDGQTVLKLFKHYHMAPRTEYLKEIALPGLLDGLRTKAVAERAHRIDAIFESHRLAFEALREETGLVHVQLEPSDAPWITLYDKIGVRHEIDLGRAPFALQKRAALVFESLKDQSDAKQKIDSLIQVIQNRWNKGICNSDPIIHRNFGFIGTQAIEIDAGSFSKGKFPANPKKELYYETLELQEWLNAHNPELANYLEQKVLYETH